MRKKNWKSKNFEDNSLPDLTPMLDVVFIMLIFFIVTASFLKEGGLELNQPEGLPDKKAEDQKSLVLVLSMNDDVSLNGRRVDIRALRALVAQHMAEFPNATVLLRAHEQASAEAYVQVADQVNMVKRSRVMLTTFTDGDA